MESDSLICGGREFQSLGAEQLKARASMVLRCDMGMDKSPAEVEWRVWEGVYS